VSYSVWYHGQAIVAWVREIRKSASEAYEGAYDDGRPDFVRQLCQLLSVADDSGDEAAGPGDENLPDHDNLGHHHHHHHHHHQAHASLKVGGEEGRAGRGAGGAVNQSGALLDLLKEHFEAGHLRAILPLLGKLELSDGRLPVGGDVSAVL
jgi:hypothetical protein